MGINWRHGFDKSSNGGTTIAHTNASHVPGFQVPRMIYRLFDPATRTWSAFDRRRWTPTTSDLRRGHDRGGTSSDGLAARDKAGPTFREASRSTGRAPTTCLPARARLQYYFKAVDVAGPWPTSSKAEDAAYEVDDLPTSGGTAKAPDILDSTSFPVSTPGPAGTLLAGRTSTPS